MNNFIIAADYDSKPYQLPGLADVGSAFDDFVTLKQKEILLQLLGQTLYDAFDAGLVGSPAQRWLDLKDGKAYTYNGQKMKWEGMAVMLKPFIYAQWLVDQFSVVTINGTVSSSNENSDVANSGVKICRAHNEFIKFVANAAPNFSVLWNWFFSSISVGNQGSLFGYLYTSDNVYVADVVNESLGIINYLSNNFKFPGKMNTFDL